ncbi:alanine racemase [Shewanella surugensis]|uniref:Alanine racemase n=1 Tax=Shewanella surugensis TaxID=212020 RepID=A0ABT0LI93_9GAMM|nr:alanine racemase [Shewanella surugensis]MCL1127406.1 alanine racemase [Shewanella surugensis]
MPTLTFNKKSIINNIDYLNRLCDLRNLRLQVVVKGVEHCAEVVGFLLQSANIDNIAIANAASNYGAGTTLIAQVGLEEYGNMIQHVSVSYHSNMHSIKKVAQEALKQSITHKIIISVDMGDCREGIQPHTLVEFISAIKKLNNKNIKIEGVTTNYACCSGLMPTIENLQQFAGVAKDASEKTGVHFNTVSVGGSAVLSILESEPLPAFINEIRIGEALFLGNIPAINRKSKYLENTTVFEAEVVDVGFKEIPQSQDVFNNALGERMQNRQSSGRRKRVIFNFGSIHTTPEKLTPPPGFKLISVNSNCTVYDITDAPTEYNIGDRVTFEQQYAAFLTASHSINVKKIMY